MKICIVAHNAYGALTGEESGHIGGVERQTALLSEWFCKNGHEVSVITWNEGGEKVELIAGIKIIKLCKVTDGLPILRFFTPRWSSLTSALRSANGDVYYHNCAEHITGQVSLWCKLNNKPFIYSVASDADCQLDLPTLKSKREKFFFRYGLTHANLVIAQTKKQQFQLKFIYDLDSEVINMPATPPDYIKNFKRSKLFSKQKVVWVGRIHYVKRPEWIIKIAQAMPDVQFEVLGPPSDDSEHIKSVLNELKTTKNIDYLGKVNRYDMPAVYQNASILCCTSIYEGFPNTYLEAWSYGVPVITTIDPDDIIKNYQLGFQALTQQEFILKIRALLEEPDKWEEFSKNSHSYYLQHHEQNQVMKAFEEAFLHKLSSSFCCL